MISRTMYTIAWYELPTLFKTEICLLMLRSQKSSQITAGKFYTMHLENFSVVRNYIILEKCMRILHVNKKIFYFFF